MKLFNGKLSGDLESVPSRYELEQVIACRQQFDRKREQQFHRLERGMVGEQQALDYLRRCIPENWTVIQNLWVDFNGTCEFDLLLVTDIDQVIVFEIKNYSGIFTYENGSCIVDDKVIASNCIAQTKKAHINLQAMIREVSSTIQVHGVLVFISPDNWVDIKSEVSGIQILMANQFLLYLKKIVAKAKSQPLRGNTSELVLKVCQKYRVENPYAPKPVDSSTYSQLKKGIHCEACQSFQIEKQGNSINCRNCGASESKEKAILRTIHEYGVLNFESNLSIGELLEFFDNQVSKYSLRNVLQKYFGKMGNSRYTYYINKKIPFNLSDYPELI